jgi:hypothetical protein
MAELPPSANPDQSNNFEQPTYNIASLAREIILRAGHNEGSENSPRLRARWSNVDKTEDYCLQMTQHDSAKVFLLHIRELTDSGLMGFRFEDSFGTMVEDPIEKYADAASKNADQVIETILLTGCVPDKIPDDDEQRGRMQQYWPLAGRYIVDCLVEDPDCRPYIDRLEQNTDKDLIGTLQLPLLHMMHTSRLNVPTAVLMAALDQEIIDRRAKRPQLLTSEDTQPEPNT